MASGTTLRLKEVEKWSSLTPSKPLEVPKICSTLQNAKKGFGKNTLKDPSLEEMTRLIRKITKDVEQNWEDLDINQKELLTSMVYAAMDHLHIPVKGSVFTKARWHFKFRFAKFRGEEKQISAWKSSVVSLYNAILNAVEHENKEYQRDLNTLFKEVTFDPNAGTLIEQERARDVFRNLSNQAIKHL